MLDSARKILVAHAEMSSRSGWKAISPMTFIRLWLSSATTVTDVTKALFLMENATSADFDRLLSGVYSRIERGPLPTQTPLPLMPAPQDLTGFPLNLSGLCVEPQRRLATPEDQLVEWLIEANATLGTPTVLQAMQAYATDRQDLTGFPLNLSGLCLDALLTLAESLPSRLPELSPSPTALSARLTTLAEIMQRSPNLEQVGAGLKSALKTRYERGPGC